jgi:hypothetical protein
MGFTLTEAAKMFLGDAIERSEDVTRMLKEIRDGKFDDPEFIKAYLDTAVIRASLVVQYAVKALQYAFADDGEPQ